MLLKYNIWRLDTIAYSCIMDPVVVLTLDKEIQMSSNRAVLLTEKEISLLYIALTELRVFSEKETVETNNLKTKLFETVCLPATA